MYDKSFIKHSSTYDMERIRVGSIGEVKDGKPIYITHKDKEIMVVNLNGKFYAISDICTHAGANLHEGRLEGNKITCPWHSAVWDVTTGKLIKFPARLKDLESYQVSVEDGYVYILL